MAVLVIIIFFAVSVEVQLPGDRRETGGIEDIEALAERDDLNVIFVLIDTLRADHLSAYGYERDTSPTLTHFANRGVRFDRHLAQSSWTKCSMASLWTGLYPASNGITRFDHGLPDDVVMPAEIFKDAGFQTIGLFRNGWVAPRFGFGQGFDVYTRPAGTKLDPKLQQANPTMPQTATDGDAVDVGIEFIRRSDDDQRWFLYLHLMDVHEYTYTEDTALFGAGHADMYDNSILWTDNVLAKLMRFLTESGEMDRTLVVITSDHGEAFRERGIEGHARRVYRESTEIPFVVIFPFALDPGVSIDIPTNGVDVWPTVLDLVGLPSLSPSEGVSRKPDILARLRGETLEPDSEPGYTYLDQRWGQPSEERHFPTVGIVDGDLRYVYTQEFTGNLRQELFDHAQDPAELRDVSTERPEDMKRLEQLAVEYLEREPVWDSGVNNLELNELELNQLRALGYEIP